MKKITAGRALSKILLLVIALVLLAVAAYVPYVTQQHKINNLNNQLTSLRSQLSQTTPTPSQPSSTPSTNQPSNIANTYTSAKGVEVSLFYPQTNARVTNPVAVIGVVPGSWSFEASFPMKLMDGKGNVVAQTTAHVLGDWMTDKPVPFSAQLTYSSTPSGSGTLLLQKDNPSGLPQNDDSISIPVNF